MTPDLRGQKVVVFGLGKSGLGSVRLLAAKGAKVTGLDARTFAQLGPTASELKALGAELALGPTPEGLLESADLVVVSPGVPLSLPELKRAKDKGVRIWGEVELAYRFLPEGVPFIGITGTNGKSTTTALTGELFTQGGRNTFVGGNLGRPLTEAALCDKPFDAHVVELSSFQLEGIDSLRAHAAAILNLTPDHVDRYPSHEAYGEAKARIFQNQREGDFAVVNADDAHVMRLARGSRGKVYGFSLRDGPVPEGLAGLAVPVSGGFRFTFGEGARLLLRSRSLRGEHNLQNAMAAALLAHLSGVDAPSIQRGLDSYPGLAHRLEYVRTLNGVEWINDSKATNVDSTLVALKAFPANVWLIAGGRGKGTPYEPMVQASMGRVKGVLTVGEDAPTVEAAYRGRIAVHACGTLERAVERARELAKEGDVVLLSPACASYDQFKNFEHRGETFKRLVGALS
ncbi:MAG TPA: UDP-N-acetylmuramoyl-L-alanine--D-glutamate ligase [Myxococcaceae bacterium]|nr:UDP-N-acetylmuramoyl-L-alanine--D-glutamate ligase [Myxococcaceae bacterium]